MSLRMTDLAIVGRKIEKASLFAGKPRPNSVKIHSDNGGRQLQERKLEKASLFAGKSTPNSAQIHSDDGNGGYLHIASIV